MRLVRRDLELLSWIGEGELCEGRQVAERFEMDRRNCRRRLELMVALGYLSHTRIFHGRPGAYAITAKGVKAAELGIPAVEVSIVTYEERVATTWVRLALEREFGQGAIVTRRTLEACTLDADGRSFWLDVPAVAGRWSRHFPDFLLSASGRGPAAVEVLRMVAPRRLEAVLRAYVAAELGGPVRFYASRRAELDLWEMIERCEARHAVQVWPLALVLPR